VLLRGMINFTHYSVCRPRKQNRSSPSCQKQDGDERLNKFQNAVPPVVVLRFEILNARLQFNYEIQ